MAITVDWGDIKDRLLSIVFPERCVLCGEVVAYDDMWCGKCELPEYGEIDCGRIPNRFAGALAATEYTGSVVKAIWKLKNKSDKRTLLFFAELMQKTMRTHWQEVVFDVVVPVPVNPARLKTRGFNQAEKLAEVLSGFVSAPVKADALVRHDDSQVQRTLKRDERGKNAEKAYHTGDTGSIGGRTVLLVDDVFTTGATLAVCADKLLNAGAGKVYVAAAAAVRARAANRR